MYCFSLEPDPIDLNHLPVILQLIPVSKDRKFRPSKGPFDSHTGAWGCFRSSSHPECSRRLRNEVAQGRIWSHSVWGGVGLPWREGVHGCSAVLNYRLLEAATPLLEHFTAQKFFLPGPANHHFEVHPPPIPKAGAQCSQALC